METNDTGLPLPGRELDAWICEHVLSLDVVHHAWPCGYVPEGCELGAATFFTKDKKLVYPGWFDELHPVYLPEYGTWPLELYAGVPGKEELYCHVEPCPFVSTTSAFFEVRETMAARGYEYRLTDNLSWLIVEMNDCYGNGPTPIVVEIAKYDSREKAEAHAVCACAWKAEGGEE